MSRSGTTQSTIRRRRGRGNRTARLATALRRFGLPAVALLATGWLGTWLVTNGTFDRALRSATLSLYGGTRDAGFAVRDIQVEGRVNTDADVLRALVGLERGDAIFAFRPADIKERIERVSWVRRAHVERRLPDVVYIRLEERTPLALWQHQGKLRLIADDGETLTDEHLERWRDRLLVVGEGAPEKAAALIKLLDAEDRVRPKVKAAILNGDRRWDLKMDNGVIVQLPEDDTALALRRLAQADEGEGLLSKDITMVDLRDAQRLIVRTRPGAAADYETVSTGGHNL